MTNRTTLALSTLALIITMPAYARPMTETDLATMNRLLSPTASPDGKLVVIQMQKTDLPANKRRSDLYLMSLNGAADNPAQTPKAIASKPEFNETSPAFSPDGKYIYYLSNESGADQIWRYTIQDETTAQVSNFKSGVDGFKISPDGKLVAVWGETERECRSVGCDGETEKPKPATGSGKEYDQLFVRHWDSWKTPGTYNRIFTYGIGDDGKLYGSGHPLDEMSGTKENEGKPQIVGNAPSKPLGGGEEIAWGADNQTVYFALRIADRDEPTSTNLDIYSSDQNYDATKNLTPDNKATDTLPAPSPDGKWLAWAEMARPGYEADRLVLMLKDLKTGSVKPLTQSWDRSVASIAWAPDSTAMFVTAQDVLDHPVFKVDLKGKVTRLTQAGNVVDVIPQRDGSLLYTMNSATAANDLYLRTAKGEVRKLTDVNAEMEAQIDDVTVQRFSFAGANGDQVWGQITKPVGTTGKLPVALLIHGGPQGSFGNSWSYRWNPRVIASQGYAVVTIDFHGSTGYGQAFTDSINKDWGGKPLEDLKLGMAALPGIDPQVDTANACALGGSYGGYLTNWIAGNWPDGFKCLVTHAGIFDLRSFAMTTEELWFDEWDQGGPWWTRTDAEKWNPVNHITKWKTPTLFTQGEKDFRVPYAQTLAAFTVMQRQGIKSKLVMFPDENHWILKPKNSVQWHRNVFDWLQRHLKPGEAAD
jgi:dipeptidyl aminopeptidase/acylaminoacyl peptidase